MIRQEVLHATASSSPMFRSRAIGLAQRVSHTQGRSAARRWKVGKLSTHRTSTTLIELRAVGTAFPAPRLETGAETSTRCIPSGVTFQSLEPRRFGVGSK